MIRPSCQVCEQVPGLLTGARGTTRSRSPDTSTGWEGSRAKNWSLLSKTSSPTVYLPSRAQNRSSPGLEHGAFYDPLPNPKGFFFFSLTREEILKLHLPKIKIKNQGFLLHQPFEPLGRPLLSTWQLTSLLASRPGPESSPARGRRAASRPTRSSLRTFLLQQPVIFKLNHSHIHSHKNFSLLFPSSPNFKGKEAINSEKGCC